MLNYFWPKAGNVVEWVVQWWDSEEWPRGGLVAFAEPGTLGKYGTALTRRFEGVHFVGTEAASYWTGYMDGAIWSGEMVAKEILEGK